MRPFVVLYNDDDNVSGGSEEDRVAVVDVRDTVDAVAAALRELGPVEVMRTGRGDPEEIAHALKRFDPRCVFNLAEAARGVAGLEACVAGLLDLLGLPYTGSGPQTLSLCLDKPKTKLLLRGAGIRVPPGVVIHDADRDSFTGLEYPLIVKPACMDASHGIDDASVVHDEAAARAKAAEVIRRFPPAALVERFIDGEDALVAIIQQGAAARPTVLPLGMIDFRMPPGVPRVSTFASKWAFGTDEFDRTPGVYPAPFAPEVAQRIRAVAAAAFEATSCRDYARVDVRVDWKGRPFVLEVNPNPSLSQGVGVARAAGLAGLAYAQLVQRFAKNAEERGAQSALSHVG
jgi:D-alanine-D-alanine ligase